MGFFFELGENFSHRLLEGLFDNGPGSSAGKRRYIVLQKHQLFGDFFRQQVFASGQHLTKLYKNRPQIFQCKTNTLATITAVAEKPVPGH